MECSLLNKMTCVGEKLNSENDIVVHTLFNLDRLDLYPCSPK